MNYFIDFEATQFSNEIISVGCVRADGTTFYEEVRAKRKITPFITSLTGITDEQNKVAASSDEVFERFFNWLIKCGDEKANFYCYGNSDIDFIRKNLALTTNIKAQAALSIIGMSLKDYSKNVKTHFGLIKNLSLIKLIAYYRGVDSIEQKHNALEDAIYLKEAFEHVEAEKEVIGHPFPDYESEINNQQTNELTNLSREKLKQIPHEIKIFNNEDVLECTFNSLIEARKWVISKLGKIDQLKVNKRKVENKIINAYLQNKTYRGYKWIITVFKRLEGDKK